jgi:hypothetical protein
MAYHQWNRVARDLLLYFSKDEAWNYVTALRGPDVYSPEDTFKRIVTAVIRGDCSDESCYCINDAYGMHNLYLGCLVGFTAECFCSLVEQTSPHTVHHCSDGFGSLISWYKSQETRDEEAIKLLTEMGYCINEITGRDGIEYSERYLVALKRFFDKWEGDAE